MTWSLSCLLVKHKHRFDQFFFKSLAIGSLPKQAPTTFHRHRKELARASCEFWPLEGVISGLEINNDQISQFIVPSRSLGCCVLLSVCLSVFLLFCTDVSKRICWFYLSLCSWIPRAIHKFCMKWFHFLLFVIYVQCVSKLMQHKESQILLFVNLKKTGLGRNANISSAIRFCSLCQHVIYYGTVGKSLPLVTSTFFQQDWNPPPLTLPAIFKAS